jgi:hypothetical protein
MLLRGESVESPMSQMGPISDLDVRNREVRFAPKNGHHAARKQCPVRADSVAKVFLRHGACSIASVTASYGGCFPRSAQSITRGRGTSPG